MDQGSIILNLPVDVVREISQWLSSSLPLRLSCHWFAEVLPCSLLSLHIEGPTSYAVEGAEELKTISPATTNLWMFLKNAARQLKQIQTLHLHTHTKTATTRKTVRTLLLRHLPQFRSLHKLIITEHLAPLKRRSSSLFAASVKIDLGGVSATTASLPVITDELKQLTQLKVLFVNKFCGLLQGLPPHLEQLHGVNLHGTHLQQKDGVLLSTMLPHTITCLTLDLSSNVLGSQGVTSICCALQQMGLCKVSLNLADTSFGKDASSHLCEALQQSMPTLEHLKLNVSKNHIDDTTFCELLFPLVFTIKQVAVYLTVA
eukprot:TRINITY_DN52402_c0_g1_i4.p1 TRINITY_DN52402_c0_g1~~TRINITY_DN52402_c0_g1_i4.p1  ORF type:complete len:316 (-),score=6.66 TRINITY_DN52402_c0_g1_i4:268-1215(-)